MKRKLLYLTSIMLLSALSVNAQTKVWDLANNGAFWPITSVANSSASKSDFQSETVVDKLGLFPGMSGNPATDVLNFGIIAQAIGPVFSDDLTFVNRFQMGGTSNAGATNLPKARYLYFTVDGPCEIKVWFKHGSNSGAARNMFVSDGTTVYGTSSAAAAATNILTANYTGSGGKIYIYGDASNYLYQIQVKDANVTTPSLGINDFQKDTASNIYSNGKLVFVSNVKSDTKVDVYGISGVLVKSFTTGADTSFDLNTGIYVVKSKSAEGEKSVKVLVN